MEEIQKALSGLPSSAGLLGAADGARTMIQKAHSRANAIAALSVTRDWSDETIAHLLEYTTVSTNLRQDTASEKLLRDMVEARLRASLATVFAGVILELRTAADL